MTRYMRNRLHALNVWIIRHQITVRLFCTFMLGAIAVVLVFAGAYYYASRAVDADDAMTQYEQRITELEDILNGRKVMVDRDGGKYAYVAKIEWQMVEESK